MLLTIEKLIYGGDGLARLPADDSGRGKAVFAPFVLAGEKVEASVHGQKRGFARARVQNMVEASAYRVEPGCPHFARCGGCHYQHASYEHQLEIKKEILRENLRRGAKVELQSEIQVHASPPWNYRNRSRLQVRTAPAFAAGYFRVASHDLLPVEECPISSPLINRGIAALWVSGRAGKVADGVREVEFFANGDDTRLLVEISCTPEAKRSAVRSWAEEFQASLSEIVGLVGFRAVKSGDRPITELETFVTVGDESLTYVVGKTGFRVSAGGFFQTNRHLIGELVKVVTQGRSGETALDLYSGVGLFSTALACDFRHIVCVESSHTSSGDLRENLPSNGKSIRATVEEYLSGLKHTKRDGSETALPQVSQTPDLAVVDPPRSGLGDRVAHLLARLGAPRITYVSCDPATLARDLVPLLAEGYRVERAHLVDLFPQTYHLESVLHLTL